MNDRVKHRSTPAEPFGTPGQHGVITRTKSDGKLRIAPSGKGSPALAYVEWSDDTVGTFYSWERLSDLQPVGKKK